MAKDRQSPAAPPPRPAGRMRFQITLPSAAARGALVALVASWSGADRVHEAVIPPLRDGVADADIRARLAQQDAAEMRGALRGLVAAHPGTRIRVHECRHGIDDGQCDQPEEL